MENMENLKVYNSNKKRKYVARTIAGGVTILAIIGLFKGCGLDEKLENRLADLFEGPEVILDEDDELGKAENLNNVVDDILNNDQDNIEDESEKTLPDDEGHGKGDRDNNNPNNNQPTAPANTTPASGTPITPVTPGYIAPNPGATFQNTTEPMPTYTPSSHGYEGTNPISQDDINNALNNSTGTIGDYGETTGWIDPNTITQGSDGDLYINADEASESSHLGETTTTSYEADDMLYYATDGSAFYTEADRDAWNDYLSNGNTETAYYVDENGDYWASESDYTSWTEQTTSQSDSGSSYYVDENGDYWASEDDYNAYVSSFKGNTK